MLGVEHLYGTIKRQWGFSYVSTKRTIQRASADVGFMMTAYNLRHIINIVGLNKSKQYMKSIVQLFCTKQTHLKPFLSSFTIFKQLLKQEARNALLNLILNKQNYKIAASPGIILPGRFGVTWGVILLPIAQPPLLFF